MKSAAFYIAVLSVVVSEVFNSTHFLFVFILICNFMLSTTVVTIFSQLLRNGVAL